MARSYTFRDLITYSGATKNEVTNWVQKGLIRPDVKATKGTGDHRTFGFLDVFEACVVRKLNQIPGGMPIVQLSHTISRIRFDTAIGAEWALFLDPTTRTPSRFWLCRFQDGVSRILDRAAWELLLTEDRADVVITLRIDNILIELEQKTQDHCTAAERGDAWTKREAADEPSAIEPCGSDALSGPTAIAAKAQD